MTNLRLLLCLCALTGLALTPSASLAKVFDAFTAGALAETGAPLSVNTTQTGLDSATVVGGGRYVSASFTGDLAIGGPAGQLVFDHDGPDAAFPTVQYGDFQTQLGRLSVDLTDGGAADRLFIRVVESVPASQLMGVSVILRSGSGGAAAASGGIAIDFPASASPYVISVPFAALGGSLDLTDIDGANFTYFLRNGGRLAIDSIDTGSIPLGDLDANGLVELADYDQYMNLYGVTARVAADANGDGVVNAADYTVWRDNLPAANTAATAVPEATACFLAASALAPLCGAARRR